MDQPQERSTEAPRASAAELRLEAAAIAIDMEQGHWVDPETGEHWPEGRPPSKTRIARALGFAVANRKTLSFMREPEWTRTLQWERIRREADGNPSLSRAQRLVALISDGLLLELARRVLLTPGQIENRVLVTESRQFIELQTSLAAGQPVGQSAQAVLESFAQAVRRLPPAARARAAQLLQEDLGRLTAAAERMTGLLEPPSSENDHTARVGLPAARRAGLN
jgi:hypothetical protein